jgi:hypothetical protein
VCSLKVEGDNDDNLGTAFVWELRKMLTKNLPSNRYKDTGECVGNA